MEVAVWLYPGENANWHFVSVPKPMTSQIRAMHAAFARGWGSLPVSVRIGKTTWKTSLFPENKAGTYLLPLKASVRRAEGIESGDAVKVTFQILV